MLNLYFIDVNVVTLSFILFWALTALGCIFGLRRTHAADVQTVWYFFSLSLVITMLAVTWGHEHDAFDTYGDPKGEAGNLLTALLDIVSDSKADAIIVVQFWLF